MKVFKYRISSSFLKDYIAGLPRKGRGEVSRIALQLRISTTLASLVVSGEKIFTPEQAEAFARYLGLSNLETTYFNFMIQFERASTAELKEFWRKRMEEIKASSMEIAKRVNVDRTLSETEKAIFYSTPLYSAIRLFCSTREEGRTLDDLCHRFDIPRSLAAQKLNFLVETGLWIQKNDLFQMGPQKTHLESRSPHFLRHHNTWRMRAIQQSETLLSEELMYTAPVSLSKKDFEKLRESMLQFISEFLKTVHDSPAEDVGLL